jgi:IstB-like ATP binding protein
LASPDVGLAKTCRAADIPVSKRGWVLGKASSRYLPINYAGAVLFFQLMNRRHEHASTVLTSNKGFEQWGEVHGRSPDRPSAASLPSRQHPRQQLMGRGESGQNGNKMETARVRRSAALWHCARLQRLSGRAKPLRSGPYRGCMCFAKM